MVHVFLTFFGTLNNNILVDIISFDDIIRFTRALF